MPGIISDILAIFQKGLGFPCIVSAVLKKNVIMAFDKFFLFWVPRKTVRQKLESAFAFTVKHSKITVCTALIYIPICMYIFAG